MAMIAANGRPRGLTLTWLPAIVVTNIGSLNHE